MLSVVTLLLWQLAVQTEGIEYLCIFFSGDAFLFGSSLHASVFAAWLRGLA